MHHPRVLVETAVAQGADRTLLLENTGITEGMLESPDARISYAQFAVLTSNALRITRNPALGIDVGKNLKLTHLGVLGLAVMSSATVGDALEVSLRHYRIVAPAWDLELATSGALARLSVREGISLAPFRVFATEALLAGYATQAQFLAGEPFPIERLRLPYPRPSYADRYREFGVEELVFDAGVTEAEFDARLLGRRVRFADPATARLADEYCSRQMAPSASIDGVVAQVRRLLSTSRGHFPEVEELAHALQTSARTLRRSLQSMGTSYQELVDEVRRERAREWVKTTRMTFGEVAAQLGFSDVRSFRRAFKRWTGRTPGEFRDGAGGEH
jgi:AraC-like DNA-binding protein